MSSAIPVQPPGQPQSKAAPIAQLTVPLVQSDNEGTSKPIEKTRPRHNRQPRDLSSATSSSTDATIALVQRVLTPDKYDPTQTHAKPSVIEEILPPLTSSNDVDLELYAILAIIVKDFVNTWYTKITTDHGFVEEIIQIIAHCSRALEQRLRKVDIAELLLDEIPLLVKEHVESFRTAKRSTLVSPYSPSLRHLYHELNPHPALILGPSPHDPDKTSTQDENERTYRQLLVQGTLAILLPTEDLQNGPLRVLVGDIIADLILGQALAGKVSEGWFLHDALYKVTAILTDKVQPKTTGTELRDDAKDRLEKFGLLSSDSESQHRHSSVRGQSKIAALFWRMLQYGYLMCLFLRYVLKEVQTVHQRPKRRLIARISTSSPALPEKGDLRTLTLNDQSPRPVLEFGVHSMISTLLKVGDRMPWFASTLIFLQHVLVTGGVRVGGLDSILDRFLYHTIETHVLTPSLVPMVLRNLRVALFPNNCMGPPAPPAPSPEERCEIKRRTAKAIFELIPRPVATRFYAADDDETIISEIEKDMLDPLDDVYLNKHLVYAILELVLMRLIPELQTQSIGDLLAERGVEWDEAGSLDDIDVSRHGQSGLGE